MDDGSLAFLAARRVLELAVREALALRERRVDTEHILLALLRDGEGVVPRILADLGTLPRSLVSEVVRQLGDRAPVGHAESFPAEFH